jgi:hypothetical protein
MPDVCVEQVHVRWDVEIVDRSHVASGHDVDEPAC